MVEEFIKLCEDIEQKKKTPVTEDYIRGLGFKESHELSLPWPSYSLGSSEFLIEFRPSGVNLSRYIEGSRSDFWITRIDSEFDFEILMIALKIHRS